MVVVVVVVSLYTSSILIKFSDLNFFLSFGKCISNITLNIDLLVFCFLSSSSVMTEYVLYQEQGDPFSVFPVPWV